MKAEITHISEKTHFDNTLKSVISFKKFIEFIEYKINTGPSIKIPYFKWILKKFKKFPELTQAVPIENINSYEEILELISTSLLPLAADEMSLWALSGPLSPEIFYGTNGFHELMSRLKHPSVIDPLTITAESDAEKILQDLQYGMVLEKIYKLPFLNKTEWVHKFVDPDTGLDKYYQFHIDTRFVDIRPIAQQP